jgi:uncharacterized protein (UPF0332 family)
MTIEIEAEAFLAKADENLAAAESELGHGRYNCCANRSYYACFQAAVAALIAAGVRPPEQGVTWSHAFVQAEFVRRLVRGRKHYSASLQDALPRTYELRVVADYRPEQVSRVQAERAVRRAREFVEAVLRVEGEAQ